MTIATVYLSPEGIVLGADSTSSIPCDSGLHYFNFNQKLYEIGENSTLGMLTWGLGALGSTSYRTLLARLADDLSNNPASSVMDVADRWTSKFWIEYSSFVLTQRCKQLHAKAKHDPTSLAPDQNQRTKDEEKEYDTLRTGVGVGFCIAGYVLPDRNPEAAHVFFDPLSNNPPKPHLDSGNEITRWWGVPNIIDRLIHGADSNLKKALIDSGNWSGTEADLNTVIAQQTLVHGSLPIRDAIDYMYSCIHCTIKAMKFSNMPQVCGGPIEIAVITTDRKFRWVRHKPWDAAILDGEII